MNLILSICCLFGALKVKKPQAITAWSFLVPKAGLEPARDKSHCPLKTACLPIPPLRRLVLRLVRLRESHDVKQMLLCPQKRSRIYHAQDILSIEKKTIL